VDKLLARNSGPKVVVPGLPLSTLRNLVLAANFEASKQYQSLILLRLCSRHPRKNQNSHVNMIRLGCLPSVPRLFNEMQYPVACVSKALETSHVCLAT